MCGILVAAGTQADMTQALGRLTSRGPDDQGTWASSDGHVRFGHTRLAINDLSPAGRQPMTGRSSVVICNGEMYNAPELRRRLEAEGCRFQSSCDTEVLVHGYEQWGLDTLLDRLRGMFAFAIWDDARRELLAAVDHAGMKPLVFQATPGSLHVASTCDALLDLLTQRPDLDRQALCHMLCLGYCPAPWTVWKGVCKLGPGQVLRWRESEGVTTRTWWSPPEQTDDARTDEEFESLFEQIVDDHLLSDVPVGLLLSGGLDSTSLALALARRNRSVRCITLALDSDDDESGAARSTCAHLGLDHACAPLSCTDLEPVLQRAARASDEPQAFGALLTSNAVMRSAREHAKVMIAGDGGDEAFGGYTWHQTEPSVRPQEFQHKLVSAPHADGATRSQALASLSSISFRHAYLQAVFPRFHPREAAALFDADYDEHVYASWLGEHDRPDLPWPRRAQRLDVLGFCAGSILPKVDRSSMSVGLEIRSPFLDRRLLEWAIARPVTDGHPKAVLRRYLEGNVPGAILDRPKQGFSLRLPYDWTASARLIDTGRLTGDGVLRPDWQSFLPEDGPSHQARFFAMRFLDAWYAERA